MKKSILLILTVLLMATLALTSCSSVGNADDLLQSAAVVSIEGSYTDVIGVSIGVPGISVEYIVIPDTYDTGTDVRVYIHDSGDYLDGVVIENSIRSYCSLIRLSNPTNKLKALPLCSFDDARDDGKYTYFTKQAMSDRYSFTENSCKGYKKRSGDINYYSLTNQDSGNYGSPLINEKNQIVGICEDGKAVAIDFIVDSFNKDLSYQMGGSLGAAVIIAICLGVAILISGIVVLIVFLLKKKSPGSAPYAPQNIPQQQPPFQPAHVVTPGPATMPQQFSALLLAHGGYCNGKSFKINKKTIIGRDNSKCSVAYPLDAPGISGTHCELMFDGRYLYLTDLNSSYGTYLENGTKLIPNVTMKLSNGAKFYLAGPENTFEIRF